MATVSFAGDAHDSSGPDLGVGLLLLSALAAAAPRRRRKRLVVGL
jgi:MYXO-CTERM domain-containing protein